MKINWKTRIKHPAFWMSIIAAVMSPIMAYFGAKPSDLTTWDKVIHLFQDVISNPYLMFSVGLAICNFFGSSADHTTAGFGDSKQALNYECPKSRNESEEK